MAKNMARIKDGVVVNIEWHAGSREETECLKNVNDISVHIGDTYDGKSFYHNGEKILTPLEKVLREVEDLKAENREIRSENSTLLECILEMSEVVYA